MPLNSGEYDLGGGFFGRGNALSGEAYSTSLFQSLINTSGLIGLSYALNDGYRTAFVVSARRSDDPLSGAIVASGDTSSWSTSLGYTPSLAVPANSRFSICPIPSHSANNIVAYFTALNSSDTSSRVTVPPGSMAPLSSFNFFGRQNFRFLVRDHHPESTLEGSLICVSCVVSSSFWGFWGAGEVESRSGYFSEKQGLFSFALCRNNSSFYVSVFSPSVNNNSSRNDSALRSPNITPAPGQGGDDRFSDLYLMRDQQNGYSEPLGKVPGLIYVDMNRAENAAIVVGDILEITPGTGTLYELNAGAIVVSQWGLDISATISNLGSIFTLGTASTPTSAPLSAGNRSRTTLETNQRIRFTATPPAGLATGVDYWVLNWDPVAFTFQLAATEGGIAIVPGSDGTATITRFAALIAMPTYQE